MAHTYIRTYMYLLCQVVKVAYWYALVHLLMVGTHMHACNVHCLVKHSRNSLVGHLG